MPKKKQSKDEIQEMSFEIFDDESDTFSGFTANTTETTGKYLVLLKEDSTKSSIKALTDSADLKVASSSDFKQKDFDVETMGGADAIYFDELGVAVVNTPPDQVNQLTAATNEADNSILAVEPERIVYAINDIKDYLKGYRDAINNITDNLLNEDTETSQQTTGICDAEENQSTWGLQIANIPGSKFSGKQIKVAVLDTGMNLNHPDFSGRNITSKSFIANQAVQDGHGHGTHCIGTACGPKLPQTLPRYGTAFESDIFVGKVLSNRGRGGDSGILAGINWALANKCEIISMSLGSSTQIGEPFSQIYENVARRALNLGSLIIAAAGNESDRPGVIAPVGHPANCPSILAVGAIDSKLRVAKFSCGGLTPRGGEVDIAGPGVQIRSSWIAPTMYRTISGTSMATPHVAGIAALYAEAFPDIRGRSLAHMLLQNAMRLPLPSRDVGMGLVQAP